MSEGEDFDLSVLSHQCSPIAPLLSRGRSVRKPGIRKPLVSRLDPTMVPDYLPTRRR